MQTVRILPRERVNRNPMRTKGTHLAALVLAVAPKDQGID